MSTWHQDRAPKFPLWHAHEWTVVTDPPNRMRSSMVFSKERDAKQYMSNLKKLGRDRYSYVLPPGPGGQS